MTANCNPIEQSSRSENKSIHKLKLLLVEGREDSAVFKELCHHWGIVDIQIMEMKGIDNLHARLEVLVRDPGFRALRSLAIARDADTDAQRAFQSVRDALSKCQPFKTRLPSKAGERSRNYPATSVFIVPDNLSSGNLETMLNRTKEGDATDACIDAFFDCLGREADFQLSGGRLDKARAYARIAASSNPARSVGHSVQASGIWNLNHESLVPVQKFLSGL
ncbi:MAG: hypothetical protein OXC59_02100 [Acidimicrobiaceae bacterium]|nr:hypothetical protein [Acidimicrobiaceae bacterium]